MASGYSPKRKRKYGNKKTAVDGIVFDSKKEAKYYSDLKKREMAGEIHGLTLQPEYPIKIHGEQVMSSPNGKGRGKHPRPLTYKADFSFFDFNQNRKRVIDVKGVRTDVFALKKALVEHIYGIEVEEI